MNNTKVSRHSGDSLNTLPYDTLFNVFGYLEPTTLYYSIPYVCRQFNGALSHRYTNETSGSETFDQKSCTYENLLWRSMRPHLFAIFPHTHLYLFKKLYFMRFRVQQLPMARAHEIENVYNKISTDLVMLKSIFESTKQNNEYKKDLEKYLHEYRKHEQEITKLLTEERYTVSSIPIDGCIVYNQKSAEKFTRESPLPIGVLNYDDTISMVSTTNSNSMHISIIGKCGYDTQHGTLIYNDIDIEIIATYVTVHGVLKKVAIVDSQDIMAVTIYLGLQLENAKSLLNFWERIEKQLVKIPRAGSLIGSCYKFDFEAPFQVHREIETVEID